MGQLSRTDHGPDISFEPPDWSTQLSILATQGESHTVEYKSQLPATAEERAKLSRTVVAFANTLGGYLIYGVAEDGAGETRIVGVSAQPRNVDTLTNIVHDTVTPFPKGLEIVQVAVECKQLIAVLVPRQHKPLFALKGDPPRFFVSRQGNTYAATLADVRSLAEGLADQPDQGPSWRRWT